MKNKLCKNCWQFKAYGEKCGFFWPDKRVCTKFMAGPEDPEHLEAVEEDVVEKAKRIVDLIGREQYLHVHREHHGSYPLKMIQYQLKL